MSGRFSVEATFRAHDRMSAAVAKIGGNVERMTRRASVGLDRLDKGFAAAHRGILRTGAVVGASAAAIGAGFVALTKPARDVEDAMAKISTVITPVTGNIRAELAATQAAAVEWSRQHTASATEFLDANYNMASAGLDAQQSIAGTRAALTLATATLGDATTAGNLLATVYNNMGDKSADATVEMTRLSDVLAKTQALFQIKDLGQLNESLKMGMPAAIQYGISIEQVSNAVGALNTAGLQGSQAGTAFAGAMRKMIPASKALGFQLSKTADGGIDFVGTLRNIEKKFGSFEKMTDRQKVAFQKAFGEEGIRAVSLLLGHTDKLAENLDKVTHSTGAAAAAEAQMEATRNKRLQILKNRITAVAIGVGESLLPVFEEISPHIERAANAIGKWATANKGLITANVVGFVRGIVDNLPAIVEWTRRIAVGLLVFYTLAAAVKVGQVAVLAFRGVMALATAGGWAYNAAVKALAAAHAVLAGRTMTAASVSQAYMAAMQGATVETNAGALAVARMALNQSRLGLAVNGVTSKLGQAGLLGAALGVGYALGTWLDKVTGFSDWAANALANLTGINDELNAAGGRRTQRSLGGPARPQDESAASVGATPTPQVIPPRFSETSTVERSESQERVDVTIRDETGRAEVRRRGGRAKGASLRLRPSGAF